MALGNLPTRTDVEPVYDDPDVPPRLQAFPIAQTPYTPVFFEMINSPQGPWLQMLQRVYYTDDPIEDIIADTKAQMEAMSCEGAAAPSDHDELRRSASVRMKARTKRKLAGVAYVAPALLFVLAFTVYPFVRTFRISLTNESLLVPAKYVGLDNYRKRPP